MSVTLPPRYQVLGELHRSEWETLLRARDTDLDCDVLIRVPGPGLKSRLRRASTRDQVLREARMLSRIRHPGVSRLRDVLETPEGPVLILDPITGESLAARLESNGRIPPAEISTLAAALCEALNAVHETGIVHRNLALSNVLIDTSGRPVLTGFVFAKPWNPGGFSSIHYPLPNPAAPPPPDESLPAYYSPEQVAGRAADVRSDIFGLGCLLYRCLTGADAFPGGPGRRAAEPPDPAALAPEAPAALREAIRRCLARDPDGRFQSALELRDALRSPGLVSGAARPPAASSPDLPAGSARPESGRRAAHRRLAIGAGAAALLAVVVLYAVLNVPRGKAPVEMRGKLVEEAPNALNATYDHSYALLIGIGPAYARTSFRALPNAENDVEALAKTLGAMTWEHWDIRKLVGAGATFDNIRRALADIETHAGINDRVLLYYAGHGERHQIAEQGWIIPVDAVDLETDPSRKNWLYFDDFNKFFSFCPAKHILVALDCCFSGISVTTERGGSPEARKYSETFLTRRARLLLSSSRPNEAAWDGPPNGHSPFAAAFIEALQATGDPPLTTTELVFDVQHAFVAEGVPHTPMLGRYKEKDNNSEFVFFRNATLLPRDSTDAK